jgi:cellobiose-specific phosphotransferase system component IIA
MTRVLVDPESGELVEALPGDVVGVEPYDYAQAKRAGLGLTRETRATLRKLDEAGDAKAAASGAYRVALAKAILRAKAEHGATVAEAIAKGTDEVSEAHVAFLAAESREKALEKRLRLHSEDRATYHRWVEWSMRAPGGEAP